MLIELLVELLMDILKLLFLLPIVIVIFVAIALKRNNKNTQYKVNKIYQKKQAFKGQQTYQNYQIPTENLNKYPYKKKKLLTPTEYHFYQTLKEECDERNLVICPKVRMEDYINVTTKTEKQRYRGYIKSRHIDFIICDRELNVIAGLELDDDSHDNPETQRTDELKNKIFKNIEIPLMRVNIRSGRYREQIINILNYLVNHT